MKQPRFVVASVTGVEIYPSTFGGKNSTAPVPTSFYVLDRAYCHREVARVDAVVMPIGDEKRRRMAEAKAAELNAWDATL